MVSAEMLKGARIPPVGIDTSGQEAQPVTRAVLLQRLFEDHDEKVIGDFYKAKNKEVEEYRRSIEPGISATLESIFLGEGSPEQKAELILNSFQARPQDTEFKATHLRLLKTRFLSHQDQPAERQVLLGFGKRLGDAQFIPQERLNLLQPILDLDLNVFPEDPDNYFAKLMLSMTSEADGSGLEEQCCTLTMLSPVQSDLRIDEYFELRPKVRAKLGEYVRNLVRFLHRKTPLLQHLRERDLRIYTAGAGSAGYLYSDGHGLDIDPRTLANSKLGALKTQAEQAGRFGCLHYLDLWRQAIKHASPMTREMIVNLLTARIKPESDYFQDIFPPFLDDLLNKAFDDAMAGNAKAKALLNDLVETTQVVESGSVVFLPFVDGMAKSGNFSPAKIAFFISNFLEKWGIVFDQATDAEEICEIFTGGQDLSLEVDPEQGIVNIVYSDGRKKSVGRNIEEGEETIVQDSVQGGEVDALRGSLFLQISELLQQNGFDGKSEDEVLDGIGDNWAEIYGSGAHRTKTLNPRGSVLKLFPGTIGQVSPRIEFTYNSQKSNGVTLSDLQGVLVLSDDLRLPFVLTHDGILMDISNGDIFTNLAERDLDTFLRLNSAIVSRACDALIEPTAVLVKRADRIARILNETRGDELWERRVSEQLKANMPERVLQTERVRIRHDQDMLSIEYGPAADYEDRRLTLHEIAVILDSGTVSMVSEAMPFTSQNTTELRGKIRRGAKITPQLGEPVRKGSLRWLGYRGDGSSMLPTWAAIENVQENFPYHSLMIRIVYMRDPDTGSIQQYTLYSTFQSPVCR